MVTRKATAPKAKKPKAAVKKKPRGRPEWKPTPEQRKTIESMAGVGVPHADIARVIGKSEKTLRKHCAAELDLGEIKANANVSQSLYSKAVGDGPSAVTAAIWWEKTRQGRKEVSVTRHTGPNGGPVEYANLNEEQIDARIAALQQAAADSDA